jgi:pimeloyl-ACP methyl ester carboxylesterase
MEFRVVPGAGHWAMYERPTDFNRAALELLQRPVVRL